MQYQHLDDSELIKYALIDAPVGSLAYLLAERYAENIQDVVDLQQEHLEALDELERANAEEWNDLQDLCCEQGKRIKLLEIALIAADKRIFSRIATAPKEHT